MPVESGAFSPVFTFTDAGGADVRSANSISVFPKNPGITIYGVVGRRMYDTWHQMTRFLRSGLFDPTPVITHRFPLEDADEAMRVIKSGEAGKVIFEIA